MIVFIKGGLAVLDYFMDSMMENLDNVFILNLKENFYDNLALLENLNDGNMIIITVNNVGLQLSYADGSNYWETKNVKIYNILVDHPANYIAEIVEASTNTHFITIDEKHCAFMKENIPAVSNRTFFLPHGGKDLGLYQNSKRDIDILYVGGCQKKEMNYPNIEFLQGYEKELLDYSYNRLKNDTYEQIDNVVDSWLKLKNITVTYAQRLYLILMTMTLAHNWAMYDLKNTLIRTFAENGLHMQMHGEGWNIPKTYKDHLKLCDMIQPQECIQYMGRAKIVLNMHPFFTYGAHERVFNSMLNGAVCVSNRSKYLESRFEHNKDIIYIDFQNLDETVKLVKEILNDENKFDRIRQNAYQKVQNDTWSDRLKQIVEGT